jgi:hypothetical protein
LFFLHAFLAFNLFLLLLAQITGKVSDGVLQPPKWGARAQIPFGIHEWTTTGVVWVTRSTAQARLSALQAVPGLIRR